MWIASAECGRSRVTGGSGPPTEARPAPTLRPTARSYVAYRAFVRTQVSLTQARQGAPDAEAAFGRLVSTTLRHLRTAAVGVTLVGGLPGSGRSTLAGALADRLGVTLLSSDRARRSWRASRRTSPRRRGTARGSTRRSGPRRTCAALLDRATALLVDK
ncbi:AAA family ATPase [Streptomyces griseoincarnatus]